MILLMREIAVSTERDEHARSSCQGKHRDRESAQAELHDKVIPSVSQAPGFVAGYWTDKDSSGMSMILFESEDAATRASQMIPATIPDAVTLEDVEVREVVGHA